MVDRPLLDTCGLGGGVQLISRALSNMKEVTTPKEGKQ